MRGLNIRANHAAAMVMQAIGVCAAAKLVQCVIDAQQQGAEDVKAGQENMPAMFQGVKCLENAWSCGVNFYRLQRELKQGEEAFAKCDFPALTA